ncbi:hypothetical protein CRUP_025724 [Coryphaenoides rupestris]|nr:hypothetical protein CRUP_025724 [Coryphaenoides rupestris]
MFVVLQRETNWKAAREPCGPLHGQKHRGGREDREREEEEVEFLGVEGVPLIIAFCVSIMVGLVLGALIYILLTWASRRRAGSASITRRPPRHGMHALPRARPGFSRNSSYDRRSNNSLVSAAFSFHRQVSSPDQADLLGRKSSFRASTFHPLLQCSQIAREAEEGSPSTLPRTLSVTTSPGSAHVAGSPTVTAAPSRLESFWGNSSLRGFHATQTPPPAYESIIRAYQETRT